MANDILNRFAVNPVTLDIPRSKFSLDHSVKFSGNVGDLIPFCFFDVLPGDTFSVDTSKVIRLQPLVQPIMDNLFMDTYWFYVPYRLVWDHFVNFMGENTDTAWTPQVNYSVPKIVIPEGGFAEDSIADYLGIPPGVGAGRKINALPFRSVALVADQWFRDENYMNPVHVSTGDSDVLGSTGSDQTIDIEKGGMPFIACKFFDLFTSSLPSPQKGPAATFNLAGFAPVKTIGMEPLDYIGKNQQDYPPLMWNITDANGVYNSTVTNTNRNLSTVHGRTMATGNSISDPSTEFKAIPVNLFADLSTVTQFNVNELRMAFAVQRYYEALARGGSRYIEQVKEFFNVTSSDYRFMRSEFLGAKRVPVNVSQIEQTSATEENTTPLGDVAGMSVTGDYSSDFTKSFTEHGIILGFCVMRYNHTYQQGIERYFLYDDIFDFYNPKFANIGEQPVWLDQIYFDDDTVDTVWGYNEAWNEYRFKPNRTAGEMRSTATTPLDSWHLGDYYSSVPTMSDSWLREDKSNLDRCLAVTSEVADQFVCDFYIDAKVARPMPMYSIPGLIDHH